jgi:hypothetical protein
MSSIIAVTVFFLFVGCYIESRDKDENRNKHINSINNKAKYIISEYEKDNNYCPYMTPYNSREILRFIDDEKREKFLEIMKECMYKKLILDKY